MASELNIARSNPGLRTYWICSCGNKDSFLFVTFAVIMVVNVDQEDMPAYISYSLTKMTFQLCMQL
jgi:hypothetical protein